MISFYSWFLRAHLLPCMVLFAVFLQHLPTPIICENRIMGYQTDQINEHLIILWNINGSHYNLNQNCDTFSLMEFSSH